MKVESRKKAFRFFFSRIVDQLGYEFNPDEEVVEYILEQEVEIEKKTGTPFCPCQGRTNQRDRDMKIVCPCIPYHREHYDFMQRCWCGLFVKKGAADPENLPQISYNDFRKMQDENKSR